MLWIFNITHITNASTESKCSIVNAYYGSLRIFLTCQQVEDQDEDPPEVWCKHIAHHIKTSRRIHIQDQKVSNKVCVTNTKSIDYFCTWMFMQPEYNRITKSKQVGCKANSQEMKLFVCNYLYFAS